MLHLIKHLYQDYCLIHRKNDTRKAVKAIAIIPVEISAYIDLKTMEIQMEGDSVKTIVLPPPKIDDPNYRVDSMKVIEVRSSFMHLGGDLYTKVTEQIRDIVQRRKADLLQTSVKNNIIGQTKIEARNYIQDLLQSLQWGYVDVVFADSGSPSPPQDDLAPILWKLIMSFRISRWNGQLHTRSGAQKIILSHQIFVIRQNVEARNTFLIIFVANRSYYRVFGT